MKVQRGDDYVDLVPGDVVPEAFDIRPRRRQLMEARAQLVWRAYPTPSRALLDEIRNNLGDEVREIFAKHGFSSELPDVDPTLREAYDAGRAKRLNRQAEETKRSEIEVVPTFHVTDSDEYAELKKSTRAELLVMMNGYDPEVLAATAEVLELPNERNKWRKTDLVRAAAILEGCARMEMLGANADLVPMGQSEAA